MTKINFKGYKVAEYLVRNKDALKQTLAAFFTLLLALLAHGNYEVPTEVIAAAAPFGWLLFHMVISALEYGLKEKS